MTDKNDKSFAVHFRSSWTPDLVGEVLKSVIVETNISSNNKNQNDDEWSVNHKQETIKQLFVEYLSL